MPLYDQDSGLLVVAGMVRSIINSSCWEITLRKALKHESGHLECICLSQGDTVVDCFEVSGTAPFLSQGKACSALISLTDRLLNLLCLYFPFVFSEPLSDRHFHPRSCRGAQDVPGRDGL